MEIQINNKQCRVNNVSAYDKLKHFLDANLISDNLSEYEIRELLLPFVENQLKPNEWLLYDGNIVWNVKRLIKNFKVFVKYYDYNHFTNYLYKFFHLQCGTIAHYNKAGWLNQYPDLNSLKKLFHSNEYGQAMTNHSPNWHYDAKKAIKTMHAILFKSYT